MSSEGSEQKTRERDDARDDVVDSKEGDAMRALLKRSLGGEPDVSAGAAKEKEPDILRGVQRKIRQRSKGKFYGDGWSTTQSKVNYALVAVIMLILIALAYYALGPMGISAH